MIKSLIIGLTLIMGACSTDGPSYQQEILDLKDLDFSRDAELFYQSATQKSNLDIDSKKQFVEVHDLGNGWSTFEVKKFSSKDIVAKFDKVNFNQVNAIVGKDRKFKLVNAQAELTGVELNNLYKDLNAGFGDPIKVDSIARSTYTRMYRYTWEGKGQVFQVVSIFNPAQPERLEQINARIPDKDLRIVNERPSMSLFICKNSSMEAILDLELVDGDWVKFKY
ncbi:hypothetical protein [Sphingobacterium ginsenosidimutans]